MEFIYKNALLHFWEWKLYGGRASEIFEINLLRTWFVYIESAVSPISAAQLEGYYDVYPKHGWFWKLLARRNLAVEKRDLLRIDNSL